MLTNEEEKRLTAVEERAKSNTHQINEIKEQQNTLTELTVSVGKLVTRQETVEDDVSEIKADVKTLTDKPSKRWESLVGYVLAALVGGVLTWAINGILAGIA